MKNTFTQRTDAIIGKICFAIKFTLIGFIALSCTKSNQEFEFSLGTVTVTKEPQELVEGWGLSSDEPTTTMGTPQIGDKFVLVNIKLKNNTNKDIEFIGDDLTAPGSVDLLRSMDIQNGTRKAYMGKPFHYSLILNPKTSNEINLLIVMHEEAKSVLIQYGNRIFGKKVKVEFP